MATKEMILFMAVRMTTLYMEMKAVIISMAIAAMIQSGLAKTMTGLMVEKETTCFGETKVPTCSIFQLVMM